MMDGDYRSAVHAACAEPWRIDVVVHEILHAEEPLAGVMLQYALGALRGIPIGVGDDLTLADLVQWCWEARGVHDRSLAGLAWAVVMRPRNSPRGNDLGVTFVGLSGGSGWTCRYSSDLHEEGSTLIRLGRTPRRSWMGVGKYGADVGLYYNDNRRAREVAA